MPNTVQHTMVGGHAEEAERLRRGAYEARMLKLGRLQWSAQETVRRIEHVLHLINDEHEMDDPYLYRLHIATEELAFTARILTNNLRGQEAQCIECGRYYDGTGMHCESCWHEMQVAIAEVQAEDAGKPWEHER